MRLENGQADALEIQITPAMIEAGSAVLCSAALGPETCCGDQELACDVFDAMVRHSAEVRILKP
jgi:hypothetical protein